MNIYPALDLRGGRVVRLREGNLQEETIYSYDPIGTAQQWIDQGAKWLHVVNLDGAFYESENNLHLLPHFAKLSAKIQFGGGLRSLDDMARALDMGVERIVLGTIAIREPDVVGEAVVRFGAEHICVALDARDGKIVTHGWTQVSDQTPISLARAMADRGVLYALYTDVQRDGTMIGSNIPETIRLARNTDLKIIASGGVTHMSELMQFVRSDVIEGVIIGTALYKKQIGLKEAFIAVDLAKRGTGKSQSSEAS